MKESSCNFVLSLFSERNFPPVFPLFTKNVIGVLN